MDVADAIVRRRAVKRFDPEFVIPEADERRLLELAMCSPTAFNLQHWRFVVVRDRALREAIRALTWGQPQITEASLLVVVCADMQAWRKHAARCWSHMPEAHREAMLEAIRAYYEGHPQRQRDEALRSCGIAAQTLMLAATAMGYESCPMDLSDFDAVGDLIGLPEDHLIGLFVAIGRGTEPPWPRGGRLGYDEVVVTDRFGVSERRGEGGSGKADPG